MVIERMRVLTTGEKVMLIISQDRKHQTLKYTNPLRWRFAWERTLVFAQTERLTERHFWWVSSSSIFVTLPLKMSVNSVNNCSSNINSVTTKQIQFTLGQQSMAFCMAGEKPREKPQPAGNYHFQPENKDILLIGSSWSKYLTALSPKKNTVLNVA